MTSHGPVILTFEYRKDFVTLEEQRRLWNGFLCTHRYTACSSCETALHGICGVTCHLVCLMLSVRGCSLVKLDCIWQGFSRLSICPHCRRTWPEGLMWSTWTLVILMAACLGHCCPSTPSELQRHDNMNKDLALRGPNDCWEYSGCTA